jgi:hypothetical protein
MVAVLWWLYCCGCPVEAVLFWLSFGRCTLLIVLRWQFCIAVLSCGNFTVLAVLWLLYSCGCPMIAVVWWLYCCSYAVAVVLCWLSCGGCFVVASYSSCTIAAALWRLSSRRCPVVIVLSWLSCSCCPSLLIFLRVHSTVSAVKTETSKKNCPKKTAEFFFLIFVPCVAPVLFHK